MADVRVFRAEELSEADAVEADWSVGGGGSGGWWWAAVEAAVSGSELPGAEVTASAGKGAAAAVTDVKAAVVPDIEETSDTKMSGRWPLRA